MEKNIALASGHSYQPSGFTRFLWWLSTAEPELISTCTIDRNRYAIIGLSVMCTWLFATISWCFFFSTFAASVLIWLPLGLFMGFVILCIDRALIKGINKFTKRKLMPFFLRGMLAITIGTFMAQPVVLFMFDKEIQMQASLDNEKRKQAKQQQQDTLYAARKAELQQQQQVIKQELSTAEKNMLAAQQNYIAEADGSGGTGKVGIAKIALAKKEEYEKLSAEFKTLQAANTPKLTIIDAELLSIGGKQEKEAAAFAALLSNGFLTRSEALVNLMKDNTALQWRYYLIVAILMLIELMPVMAKVLLPTGSYDEKVFLREEMETEIARSSIRKEHELTEMYNQLAMEHDAETLKNFFRLTQDDRTEKITAFGKKWAADHHESFTGFWEKVKKDVLTKQEN